eukprot:2331060-Prymnesium_polylepis.1
MGCMPRARAARGCASASRAAGKLGRRRVPGSCGRVCDRHLHMGDQPASVYAAPGTAEAQRRGARVEKRLGLGLLLEPAAGFAGRFGRQPA